MSVLPVEAAAARRLLLRLLGLAEPPRRRLKGEALLAAIEDLGFVQVDSINTVERAHHMILFSRAQGYRPDDLRRLHEREAAVFEHWTHDAAVIPTAFYPYWRHRFGREHERLLPRYARRHGGDFEAELDRVLGQVREGGAVLARDFADTREDGPRGGWWNWHGGKLALEFLWRTGRLSVARREGFQKVYDLAERVIPEAHREADIPHEEFVDWTCRSALQRLAFATPGELAGFWGLVGSNEAKAWCEAHLGRDVVLAEVAGSDGGPPRRLYARGDLTEALAAAGDPPARLRALNPFDPLLRDRQRLARLFGFDYRIEVFVPEAKRSFGYYVFPLLEKDRLIGRLDMRADRKAAVLNVAALWLEPGVKLSEARRSRLDGELDRIRRFAGLDEVRFADGWLKR